MYVCMYIYIYIYIYIPTLEEKKFKTRMASCTVTIPKDVWMEYKSYRVRMWKPAP